HTEMADNGAFPVFTATLAKFLGFFVARILQNSVVLSQNGSDLGALKHVHNNTGSVFPILNHYRNSSNS
ncbi:hypothetical protein AB9K17_23700, partial [Salmonella enterica subsp. enterica serovar Kentucky]|uniref:hypothetical protein n=1 Tax=Salmonella enterica TaxID=28901 RepID=UPI003F4BBDC8